MKPFELHLLSGQFRAWYWTEPSMALFVNPYEDLQGWKQTDWNSENLVMCGRLMRF